MQNLMLRWTYLDIGISLKRLCFLLLEETVIFPGLLDNHLVRLACIEDSQDPIPQ